MRDVLLWISSAVWIPMATTSSPPKAGPMRPVTRTSRVEIAFADSRRSAPARSKSRDCEAGVKNASAPPATMNRMRIAAKGTSLAFLPSDVPFAAILILFIVAGGADAFFTPASQSLLFDLAGADRLESANAISTLLVRVTGLIGPAFGGLLVVAIGIHTALLIHSSTSLISAVAVASTRHVVAARSVAPMNARALWRDASEGIRATMTTGWLRAVLLSDLSQTLFAVAPWFVLLPITLVPHGAADYAVAVAAFAAGGLLGALTPLKWQPRAIGRAALLAQALFALPLVALALHAPLPLLAATVVIGGYGADLGAVL